MSDMCRLSNNNWFYSALWLFQIVILVVDSTDRERLTMTKEELHKMLSHEVQTMPLITLYIRSDDSGTGLLCNHDVKTFCCSVKQPSYSYLDLWDAPLG